MVKHVVKILCKFVSYFYQKCDNRASYLLMEYGYEFKPKILKGWKLEIHNSITDAACNDIQTSTPFTYIKLAYLNLISDNRFNVKFGEYEMYFHGPQPKRGNYKIVWKIENENLLKFHIKLAQQGDAPELASPAR